MTANSLGLRRFATGMLLLIFGSAAAFAQKAPNSASQHEPAVRMNESVSTPSGQTPAPQSSQTPVPGQPIEITLPEALQRAKANSAQYQAAFTALGIAGENRVQARAVLLPNVSYANSYLYTEGNGTPSGTLHCE